MVRQDKREAHTPHVHHPQQLTGKGQVKLVENSKCNDCFTL